MTKEHIEGKIDIKEAQRRIHAYYEAENARKQIEDGTAEADIVSARIAELLGEKTFQFSPAEYQNIHRRLFSEFSITPDRFVLTISPKKSGT